MRLVFLGPPGSGKGTQAKILAEKKGWLHISTGEMLRQAVKDQTELGKVAARYMDAGDLVPDDLMLEMIKEVLHQGGRGFILDGFPRTAKQAEGLEHLLNSIGQPLDLAIDLVVDDQEVLRRLLGRYFCRQCGADFNMNTRPPKQAGRCDICGGVLIQRDDDKDEVIRNRLAVYREKTKPVEDFYRSRGLLVEIDGNKTPDEVALALMRVVEK